MKVNILFLILFLSFELSSFAATAPQVNEAQEACRRLLVEHVKGDSSFEPLSHLSSYLEHVKTGTLMVRVDLTDSSYVKIQQFTQPTSGILAPGSLRSYADFSFVYVIHGKTEALLRYSQQLSQLDTNGGLTFQFIEFLPTQMPIDYPSEVVTLDDRKRPALLEKELKDKLARKKPFIVYQVHEDKNLFFVPQDLTEPYSDFFSQEKVTIKSVHKSGRGWIKWIKRRSKELGKPKKAISVEDWMVFSPPAFAVLSDLSRINEEALPPISEDPALRTSLANCFGISCSQSSTPPLPSQAPEGELLSDSAREKIIEFLKLQRPSVRVSTPYYIRLMFRALAEKIKDPEARSDYLMLINDEISFSVYDYQMLIKGTYKPPDKRLSQAWRAFLSASQNPMANSAITAKTVDEAIRNIE